MDSDFEFESVLQPVGRHLDASVLTPPGSGIQNPPRIAPLIERLDDVLELLTAQEAGGDSPCLALIIAWSESLEGSADRSTSQTVAMERWFTTPKVFLLTDDQPPPARWTRGNVWGMLPANHEKEISAVVGPMLRAERLRRGWTDHVRKVQSQTEPLTDRQMVVLRAIIEGCPTKAIARRLGVSDRLIEMERSVLLRSFGVASTPELTLRYGQYQAAHALIDSQRHQWSLQPDVRPPTPKPSDAPKQAAGEERQNSADLPTGVRATSSVERPSDPGADVSAAPSSNSQPNARVRPPKMQDTVDVDVGMKRRSAC